MAYTRAENIKSAKKKLKNCNFLIREPLFEWSAKQKEILDLMHDQSTKALLIRGDAGTGKTFLSVYMALNQIQHGQVERLIYVRNIIESSHSPIGMLPGTKEDKISPYMEILTDKLDELLNPDEIAQLIKEKKIESIPCSFLRGKDFKKSIIIVDESQDLNIDELKTIITRVGSDSKIIFLFDPFQSDIRNKAQRNDMAKFAKVFDTPQSKEFGIHFREFDENDIVRSEFCKFVVTELKAAGLYVI